MSQIKAVFTGGVVADPERREVGGAPLLEFPVYVNHTKKNRDTGREPWSLPVWPLTTKRWMRPR